jgi:hypothetical protein
MYIEGDQTIVVDPEFSQRFEYVDRMISVFGTGGKDDRLWNLNVVPELVGKELASCNIGPTSMWRHQLERGGDRPVPVGPNFVPSYFFGGLKGPKISSPVMIGIAVDGRIVATTRTSTNSATPRLWTALVPEEFFSTSADCKVQLFEIEQLNGSYSLREMFADAAM